MTHTKGPSIHDTEWRAMLMGSEGWAVFAGHKMIASHLSEERARLIEQAPNLLEALEAVVGWYQDDKPIQRDMIDIVTEAIQKAKA